MRARHWGFSWYVLIDEWRERRLGRRGAGLAPASGHRDPHKILFNIANNLLCFID